MANDLKRLIKEATEASEHAPEHLQVAAFNKAFDALKEDRQITNSSAVKHTPEGRIKDDKKKTSEDNDSVGKSLDRLDRTKHADIRDGETVVNNSLRLLRAAKEELNIDGLDAPSIARILVDKYRYSTSRQGVSNALNRAGRYVNRHKAGKSIIFRIMAAGEEYLNELSNNHQVTDVKPKQSRKKPATNKHTKTIKKKAASKQSKKSVRTRKVGSFAALTQLYEASFFSTPRTISSIVDHLKHKHGRSFKSSEISPPLLRLLRTNKLTRDKNSEKQYEYKKT